MNEVEEDYRSSMDSREAFILVYLAAALLTYVLPYLGSNSSILNALTLGLNPAFWMHLAASITLIVMTWLRGKYVNNEWIILFPVGALLFDFAPILNWIPLVPSIFHLLAISFSVSLSKQD